MVTESQFYMWRAVFAMAHADDVIEPSEAEMMSAVIWDFDFSEEQRTILEKDIVHKQDVMDMFRLIPDEKDRLNFFEFAYQMAKVDGVFSEAEQNILTQIQRRHNYSADISTMANSYISLDLEEDGTSQKTVRSDTSGDAQNVGGLKFFMTLFKKRFAQKQF